MKLLESSNFAIEDILSFFPDFVVIDDVKIEICSALESCAAQIQSLKGEMDETTASAELIKTEIRDLERRFVLVNTDDRCDRCGRGLMGGPFYVFPCGHKFRADCLITLVRGFRLESPLRAKSGLTLPSFIMLDHSSSCTRPPRHLDASSTSSRRSSVRQQQATGRLRRRPRQLPALAHFFRHQATAGIRSRLSATSCRRSSCPRLWRRRSDPRPTARRRTPG
jgi:hypothetical protein